VQKAIYVPHSRIEDAPEGLLPIATQQVFNIVQNTPISALSQLMELHVVAPAFAVEMGDYIEDVECF